MWGLPLYMNRLCSIKEPLPQKSSNKKNTSVASQQGTSQSLSIPRVTCSSSGRLCSDGAVHYGKYITKSIVLLTMTAIVIRMFSQEVFPHFKTFLCLDCVARLPHGLNKLMD